MSDLNTDSSESTVSETGAFFDDKNMGKTQHDVFPKEYKLSADAFTGLLNNKERYMLPKKESLEYLYGSGRFSNYVAYYHAPFTNPFNEQIVYREDDYSSNSSFTKEERGALDSVESFYKIETDPATYNTKSSSHQYISNSMYKPPNSYINILNRKRAFLGCSVGWKDCAGYSCTSHPDAESVAKLPELSTENIKALIDNESTNSSVVKNLLENPAFTKADFPSLISAYTIESNMFNFLSDTSADTTVLTLLLKDSRLTKESLTSLVSTIGNSSRLLSVETLSLVLSSPLVDDVIVAQAALRLSSGAGWPFGKSVHPNFFSAFLSTQNNSPFARLCLALAGIKTPERQQNKLELAALANDCLGRFSANLVVALELVESLASTWHHAADEFVEMVALLLPS